MDAILALIGSRWSTALIMIAVGGLVLVYPPFLAVILGWGLVIIGGSILVGAYRKGEFDKQIAEAKTELEAQVESLRSRTGM